MEKTLVPEIKFSPIDVLGWSVRDNPLRRRLLLDEQSVPTLCYRIEICAPKYRLCSLDELSDISRLLNLTLYWADENSDGNLSRVCAVFELSGNDIAEDVSLKVVDKLFKHFDGLSILSIHHDRAK